jgi:glutamine---fructose-6-phosphate transaminase (isomerizing)
MCGIFGVIAKEEKYNRNELVKLLEDVAKLSQVRGKDSSGFAVRFEKEKQIDVLKGPVSIDNLLRTDEYKSLKNAALTESKIESTNNIFAALGHARLVTNGSQLEDVNNQPVVKGYTAE